VAATGMTAVFAGHASSLPTGRRAVEFSAKPLRNDEMIEARRTAPTNVLRSGPCSRLGCTQRNRWPRQVFKLDAVGQDDARATVLVLVHAIDAAHGTKHGRSSCRCPSRDD
jgi:hypothetical protein